MGIQDLREQMPDVPGIERLVMFYEEGGIQVFCIGDVQAKVAPMANVQEIKQALLKAIEATS